MKATRKSSGGTSFFGTCITASVEVMKKALGGTWYEGNTGKDKVNIEWVLETEDGDVFTVYDWKEYRPLNESDVIEWHIGGHRKEVTEKALSEINAQIFLV